VARPATSVQQIVEKIRTLSSDELIELGNFIEFLRFKTQNLPEAGGKQSMRRIQLRGILAGYEITPEMLTDVRRDLWRKVEQTEA
jgi:hypothetical protein